MLIQFQEYLTFENIYLWINFGILPFWFMLIFIPNSKISQILINSVILPLILACTYCYAIYQTILLDEPIFEVFKLYLSLDNLYTIFATESFLLIFWLHFLALNIFSRALKMLHRKNSISNAVQFHISISNLFPFQLLPE